MKNKHQMMMNIAHEMASQSKCISKNVGAVIAKDGRIISTGYNGTPSGLPNCCDVAEEIGFGRLYSDPNTLTVSTQMTDRPKHSAWSDQNEIHAEQNAIIFAAKHGVAVQGCVMYVTHSPCPTCCKIIAQSGIQTVIYDELYDRSPSNWDKILKDKQIAVFSLQEVV
tara:strand:- start:40485 stop:40985 length:501 start_codon:yes stop_codon:yes gene_type:complete